MKWEYKVHVMWPGAWTRHGEARRIEEVCNSYGRDGWQLCNAHRGDLFGMMGFNLIFKRPVDKKHG